MKGRKSDVWVCTYCHEIAYPEPAEMATDTDVNIKHQVHLYAFRHPGVTAKDCVRATGIHPKSVSSSAATMRKEGLMEPSDGSGEMFLTTAGLESALKLESSCAPVTPPQSASVPASGHAAPAGTSASPPVSPSVVADHQRERTTYADVATEEDGDTMQTSPLDTANAEIARLMAEVAHLSAQLGTVRGIVQIVTDERDMYRHSHNAALKSTPTVRLEWGAWDADSKDVTLMMHVGAFSASIAEIVIDGHTTARIWYTESIAGKCVQIQGFNLEETADALSRNIAAAGLTMPPVPALPVAK
jgi:hypothetical protein